MTTMEKFLSDYRVSTHVILSCQLMFTITDDHTIVENTIELQNDRENPSTLVLNGEHLELIDISLDWKTLLDTEYSLDHESLTLKDLPEKFTLKIITKIYPDLNTALEGLFKSGSIYCTQNEPEGFRKITYFLDRPDVMTIFTTKIIAPKKYPILLSNGNLIDSGEIDANMHFATWHDPHKKPAYLFALVAGDLGQISDTFTTMSGKVVDLHIFSEHGNESKCLHAMESLKKSMKWDEDTYGREYDLDVFHIVAVDSFNMGAMENKSLNIFNTIYVLADIETATDRDYLGVESVIGHEYFHNWTGNRITCRDWFQLTLKEGLTVLRDHDFSGDMNSRSTMRVEDIRDLREYQFPEDAGPTAHPVQPASYIEMNNFYTATVYEKGSEVIRMMATLLGPVGFRKAMDLYFDTFDWQAVTTQDYVWAMATAGKIDLTQFEETWYHQERTPGLRVTGTYDDQKKTYTMKCEQIIEKNTKGEAQKPFFYPFRIALFGLDGTELPLILENSLWQNKIQDGVLIISQAKETFIFQHIDSHSKISLNRGFSAPIRVFSDETDPVFLMQYETDGFARYEATEQFAIAVIWDIIAGRWVSDAYISVFGSLLVDSTDRLFQSLLVQIPSLSTLAGACSGSIDYDILSSARETLLIALLARYEQDIMALYETLRVSLPAIEGITPQEIGTRAYMWSLLSLLLYSSDTEKITRIAEIQFRDSRTMTLRLSALSLLDRISSGIRHPYMQEFIDTYQSNPLVIMKYFAIVGSSQYADVTMHVRQAQHEAFYQKNLPNHAKALFGAFTRNLEFFHKKDGTGYALLTDFILDIDPINPHTAARMAGAFKIFPKLNPTNQEILRPFLEKILQTEWLSANTTEIIDKILHYSK